MDTTIRERTGSDGNESTTGSEDSMDTTMKTERGKSGRSRVKERGSVRGDNFNLVRDVGRGIKKRTKALRNGGMGVENVTEDV